MNPPLDLHCDPPNPTASPLNVVELFALIDVHLRGEILGSYIPYVTGTSTPAMEDTDKVWLQLDTAGRPIAFKKYYGGRWRRVYNGMLGEIRIYSGDPTNHTIWDTDGKGQPEKEYDGWQLCNGKNGSPDLSDRFVFAGHMNNADGHTGYSSGWQSVIEGEGDTKTDQKTGGAQRTLIESKFLPPLDLQITGNEHLGSGPDLTPPKVIVERQYTGVSHTADLGNIYGADPSGSPAVAQVKYPTVPPFIAMGFIIFVGYS